ncbi:MAG: DUF2721 domain-containing protein [bacterium]|nr:DUF2721 domain-containing protein [bacterium]
MITLTTPALLFPAISLLLLAYTNRFLAIATLIRQLHRNHRENPDANVIIGQIENLRLRLHLIRKMQTYGVISFFMCVLSMIFIFQELKEWGGYIFGGSLVMLLISLGIMLRELQISTKALDLELSDME